MSNRKAMDAKLQGWQGPFFPPSMELLQHAYATYAKHGLDSRVLIAAANRVPLYRHPATHATSDGYFWRRLLTFRVVRNNTFVGHVCLAFPDVEDEVEEDGTRTDRSIAAYCDSNVSAEEIEQVVALYLAGFIAQVGPLAA